MDGWMDIFEWKDHMRILLYACQRIAHEYFYNIYIQSNALKV